MNIARQFAQTLRGYLPYSGVYPRVIVREDRLQEFEDEIDAADADAAFRAVIHGLCVDNGMRDDDKPFFFLKRVLKEKNAPDIRMICELARACDEGGIQEGEDPVSFIESKCAEVERLTEQLEDTQHKLAQAVSDIESPYAQSECVNECLAMDALQKSVDSAKMSLSRQSLVAYMAITLSVASIVINALNTLLPR